MRLVCLAPYVGSETTPQAGHQFLHHYLQIQSRRFEVTLVAPDLSDNAAEVPAESSRDYDIRLIPRPNQRLRDYGRAALMLPEQVRPAPAIDADTASLLRSASIVEFQWPETVGLIAGIRRRLPRAVLGGVTHDLHSERVQQQAIRGLDRHTRLMARALTGFHARREARAYRCCDVLMAFKSDEFERLRRGGVTAELHLLSPYLPAESFAPAREPAVLFVGAFNRVPNVEALQWLLAEIWPRVRSALPGARLIVAGGGMDEALERTVSAPDVEVMGRVDDLGDAYRRARVVVAPLLTGAGLKFKVPEAMAYGLPVVGTRVAFSGMTVPDEAFLGPADGAAELSDQLLAFLGDVELAGRMGAASEKYARSTFSLAASVDRVASTYESMAQARSRLRGG